MKIYKNAEFISCEDNNRIFSILIEDKGKIIFSGNNIPDKYEKIESIDLGGKCVVPAFGDTHIHFESFSFFHSGLDCRNATDLDSLQKLIREYVSNHPDEKIVLGFGCAAQGAYEGKLLTRFDLDKITSIPVMLVKYDGHASVANSSLIQKLPKKVLQDKGFNKDTGWFYQDAFYQATNSITSSIPITKVIKNMINGADFLAKKGIGFVHTVEGVGFPLDIDIDMMRLSSLWLPQKFRIYFQTMNLNKVIFRGLPCVGGCFATALDGCFGSEDAALKDSYTNNPNNYGVLFYSQDKVNNFVKSANRKGLQVSLHAVADRAIEQAINAYESALSDLRREDPRHIVIHADLMNKEMIEKASKLGLYFAVQTPFLMWKEEPVEYLEKILGDRLNNMIPLKSMIDAGLILGNGSDGPCTIPDPIMGIYAACNHPNSSESISPLNALKMHTNWASKLSFDEKERGTLTDGKCADFVILDKNPLNFPVEKLDTIKVEKLYLKGEEYTGDSGNIFKFIFDAIKNKL
ncbi:MAG: amidohydrolase family protein [Desulfobacterales bacterium]|nr:amidohydrolase family protein [Desulfobacterales bacterium]MBF0396974.1 amidohydrolase family protein [Desulfobacterales bacterium]